MSRMTYDEVYKKTRPDFEFYLENRAALLKNPKYYGKYLVIKDRAIVRAFDSQSAAIDYMDAQGIAMGNYIVQPVHETKDRTNVRLGIRLMNKNG